jgi:hypothetical protein
MVVGNEDYDWLQLENVSLLHKKSHTYIANGRSCFHYVEHGLQGGFSCESPHYQTLLASLP